MFQVKLLLCLYGMGNLGLPGNFVIDCPNVMILCRIVSVIA